MLKAFIFDLGNVLLLFSHDRMYEQVARLCGREAEDVRSVFSTSDLGTRLECGAVTEAEFQHELEHLLGVQFDRDLLHRAIADIFTPNVEMLQIVDQLREQGFRLVLLSNTNAIHIRWIESQYDVLAKFDACVLSHEVGAMKPDASIYAEAISQANFAPDVCFYTDDIEAYVAAGREHGFCAEVFTGVCGFRQQMMMHGVTIND